MKKIFVIPNSYENLGSVLETNIDGIILPIEHLAVNSSIYFSIDDVKSILDLTSKEVYVSLNKIMHNTDLSLLEDTLVLLNKMNVRKILFYDLAVLNLVKKLHLKKELVIFQDHLNASTYSNNFYLKRGIKGAVITNDITKDEINEISKTMPLMLICYGYLPCFYSRRYLITNYLKYIGKDTSLEKSQDKNYYIRHNQDKYRIVEEEFGTTIYTKKPINLLNDLEDINVNAIILNANFIDNTEFLNVLNDYLNNKIDLDKTKDYYRGFIDKKTIYKVINDE